MIIELYGMHYGPTAKSVTESLFTPVNGRTLNGSYRVTASGVIIKHTSGREIFIRRDGFGPVTTHRTKDGRRRYMHATCTADEPFFNVPGSYADEIEGAASLAKQLFSR